MKLDTPHIFDSLRTMTTTAERAEILAKHCDQHGTESFLGKFSAQDLLCWINLELGNEEVLDKFAPYGSSDKLSMAVANGPILHILSGNTPHAGLQSLLRGLLVGAVNLVKLPNEGSAVLSGWIEALPVALAELVKMIDVLSDDTFASAKTVIAIGSDTTMAEIQKRISPQQRFIPHGHKLSIGLVKTPTAEAAELVVRDVCAFNQQGCLSLHTVYVMQDAKDFLPLLADAMRKYEEQNPRGEIGLSESGAISNVRELIRYQAANDPENFAIEHSSDNTSWTVIYRNSPTLSPSVLNRVVTVQPWPRSNDISELGEEREFISTLTVEDSLVDQGMTIDIPRICALGESQMPSLTWHHDGFAPLGSLVRWRDIDK